MLKRQMTRLGKKGTLHKNVGKGAIEQSIPSGAMSSLGKASPIQRSLNNYVKPTPMPPVAPPATPVPASPMMGSAGGVGSGADEDDNE